MSSNTKTDKRNILKVNIWCLIWVLSWLAVKATLAAEVIANGVLAVFLIAIPFATGVAMILAYRKFLREADELLRMIQLEALAFSVGGTLVGAVTYALLVDTGMLPEGKISYVILITCICYMVGVVMGHRRFR